MSLGLYAARSVSEGSRKYFFADGNLTWLIVALSLFATSITGNQILGFIGITSKESLIPGQFGAIAALSMMILGWIFVPVFIKEKIKTVPEYLEIKYNRSSRKVFAVFTIGFYFFIRLSLTLIAAGFILSNLLNIDPFTASQIIVIITGIYVIMGGFSAVAYTHAVQSFFILVSIGAISILGIFEVGDIGIIWNKLTLASEDVIQPLMHSKWIEIFSFIGGLITGLWFWCTDQFVVQRMLSIKDKDHARRATVLAGFLHVLIMIFLLILSISAGILYMNKGTYLTFSKIISEMDMHTGLTGLISSGALAMLMASLASLYNSIATVITYDFSGTSALMDSDRKLVLKGRLITLGAVIFSILWIPIIRVAPDGLIVFLIKIPVFCAPPIAAIFVFAHFHKEKIIGSAVPVMIAGTILGLAYTAISFSKNLLFIDLIIIKHITELPFYLFVIVLFGLSYLALYVQNRNRMHADNRKKVNVNLDIRKQLFLYGNSSQKSLSVNAALSVILMIIIISMWWIFRI